MASKVRIFEARVRNGHGTEPLLFAAHSGASLAASFPLSPEQKLESVKYLGWSEAHVRTDGYGPPEFLGNIKSKSWVCQEGEPGYLYLREYLAQMYKCAEDFQGQGDS